MGELSPSEDFESSDGRTGKGVSSGWDIRPLASLRWWLPSRRHHNPFRRMGHRSLISCFQETFFPAAEFLVTSHLSVLFPGWCPIPFPEGCGLFHRLLNFHFHRSVHFYFSGVARFLSKLSFGCDLWRSVSIHSEEWMARFPSVMPVSNSFSRRSNPWFGFI